MRITISFTTDERTALEQMAKQDYRPLKDEVRFIVRQAAERRGLLPLHTLPMDDQEPDEE